ncbi:MAG: hypothetical protein KGY60_00520 [Bacteroidales bacterium]|nr:hypothetical protein [Bacteroidales bacterium]
MIRTMLFILMVFLLAACEKQEGPGGKSSIGGTVIVKEYNRDLSVLLGEYPAHNLDVYINYGGDGVIGDDMETSQNGKFKFSYLQKGNYTLWYTSDDTVPGSQSEIVIEREISLSDNQNKNLGDLFTYETKDFDEGSGTICGKVYLINYKNTATLPYTEDDIKDITPAQEEDVYLIYNENQTFNEEVETNYDGEFCFSNLIKGKYRIFVYSEDLPGGEYDFNSENVIEDQNSEGTFDLVLYQDVEITEQSEKIRLDDFYIEQE